MCPKKSHRDLTMGLLGNVNTAMYWVCIKLNAEQQKLILIVKMEIVLVLPSLQTIILQ